ncbi:hypothetical protein AX14_003465 [Amanita brunnescens Koide BX004]|nr:hypothetical protein AX14_003465 [Amanita brunnescens Koide BX004]
MHLYLTRRSHLNSSYVNNDGHVLYKVETPFKFVGLVSTIKSVLPEDIPTAGTSRIHDPPSCDPISDSDVDGNVESDEVSETDIDYEPEDDEQLCHRFAHLAEIKYHGIASSVIRYRGEEFETRKFFTKKEYGWHGFHRAFTGPDGLEYQWIFGFRAPEVCPGFADKFS